jgi:hypothetical protein
MTDQIPTFRQRWGCLKTPGGGRTGFKENLMIETITSIPGWHLYMLYAFIALFAGVHIARTSDRRPIHRAEIMLMYMIGIIGFNGLSGFIGHTVFADQLAESIGWAPGSPFQTEVAGANLAIGLIGALGFWRRDFWLPYILAKTVFGFTAGTVHIQEIINHANFAPNNIGVLSMNFLVPLLMIALYRYIQRGRPERQSLDYRPLQA